jgi:REP element-mobilizing transposase RayT
MTSDPPKSLAAAAGELGDRCSHEHERVDPQAAHGKKGNLPRLSPEFYRGHAFVHWTLTIEDRATGWLDETFHARWQLALLHACARHCLAAPAYVLMPDHIHLLWAGLAEESDQCLAMEFLRMHLRPALGPASWQQRAYDHVLQENERERSAFVSTAHYMLENPVRAGLVACSGDYPLLGCCVAGYPDLDVRQNDYWELFWRIYNRLVNTPKT